MESARANFFDTYCLRKFSITRSYCAPGVIERGAETRNAATSNAERLVVELAPMAAR